MPMNNRLLSDYAPIVMFVYNRADHFSQTYGALAKCPEAKNSILYIFSDGAKNDNAKPQVEQVRQAAKKFAKRRDFREVIITESPENKGLAKSIIDGVTKVLDQYGRAIIIEDDNLSSPYLLDYFNRALIYYADDKSVGALSGYTPQIQYPDNYHHDIFSSYRSCSCCWSTWNDRWQNIDWNLEHFSDFISNKKAVRRLSLTGNDRLIRLYRQTKGNGSSWSVRFGAHLVANDMLTIYPKYSYVQNIGCDETGTHSQEKDAESMAVDLSQAISNPKIEKVPFNMEIQKSLKLHYSSGKISDIKRYFATKYIVFKEKRKKSV